MREMDDYSDEPLGDERPQEPTAGQIVDSIARYILCFSQGRAELDANDRELILQYLPRGHKVTADVSGRPGMRVSVEHSGLTGSRGYLDFASAAMAKGLFLQHKEGDDANAQSAYKGKVLEELKRSGLLWVTISGEGTVSQSRTMVFVAANGVCLYDSSREASHSGTIDYNRGEFGLDA